MAHAADDEPVIIEEVDESEFKGDTVKGESNISAMKASQEKAKDLSYYYAHQEGERSLPEDAVIRKEDPLFRADGCGPKKLDTPSDAISDENVRWLDKFAFSDDGAAVKLYVEFPESIKDAEVNCSWGRFSVQLYVRKPAPGATYGLRIREREGWILEHERNDGFAHEIDPSKCKHRVSSSGERITLTIAKKDEKEKWYELRKKDIKSSLPGK